ncbi:MAG TPA: biotin--[acetyl-CoA-carboxylase] ligase [Tepidisphaeraceae bacterium]|nr:biotin--[acetyl-CoA-carboxylase] ligase [Tepidisphaeraceae bacterium]
MPSRSISFDLARLRAGLKPFRLHWFPRLRSTNDHAVALRARGELYAPAVVLTGHQTAGRGRGGNAWWSGRGSVTATFAFPIDDALSPPQLPLLAGLAVRDAAAELIGDDGVQLKWPNDLLYDGRKLAGLLCERAHKVDLVGVGLNVNVAAADVPRPLRDRVTSLQMLSGRTTDLSTAVAIVASHLHRTLTRRREQSFAQALRAYDRHHALVGRRVRVDPGGSEPAIQGRCEGLDATGRLLLRDGGTLHRVIAGHVTLLDA